MQIKTGEALVALGAVRQLAGQKMPFGPAMAIRRMARELLAVAEDVEAERQKLLLAHARIGENGRPIIEGDHYVFEEGNLEIMDRAYNELLTVEIEVATALTAKGMDSVEVEPNLLIALGPLVVE